MEKKPRKKPSVTSKTTAFSGETRITPKSKKEIIASVISKPTKEKFLTENQRLYYDMLKSNQITICSGLAYVLEYVDSPLEHDIKVDCNGCALYVDPKNCDDYKTINAMI